MLDSWAIWKEEFDEINKIELKKEENRELARRLLIFTEGFMYKLIATNPIDLTKKSLKILMEIREKNLEMMKKAEEFFTKHRKNGKS